MPWRETLRKHLIPQVNAALDSMDQREASSLIEIRMCAGCTIGLVFPWGVRETDEELFGAELREQLAALTGYAMYRFERQMAEGYIPLAGGCRAGICGRMTRGPDGAWQMAEVSSICLRIARSVPGAGGEACKHLLDSCGMAQSVLFFGPPGCGKTTILRAAAEYLAETAHMRVAAVDEREELFPAGSNSQARRIDVLAGCDRAKGMMMLLRTMSPQVIVCDEIGSAEDAAAIGEAVRCGVAVLASAHAANMQGLMRRQTIRRLYDTGVFDRYILLERMSTVKAVWDRDGKLIWEESTHGQLGRGSDGDDCGQRCGLLAL